MARISDIHQIEKQMIRDAVTMAARYWPNAHLGDSTRREDIRSAFAIIRSWEPRIGLSAAVYRVEKDALSHVDM